jgi:hypothetical protein
MEEGPVSTCIIADCSYAVPVFEAALLFVLEEVLGYCVSMSTAPTAFPKMV